MGIRGTWREERYLVFLRVELRRRRKVRDIITETKMGLKTVEHNKLSGEEWTLLKDFKAGFYRVGPNICPLKRAFGVVEVGPKQ